MAPLLRTYFNPSHRSFLSTLFASTFLAALGVVAVPCPVDRAAWADAHDEHARIGTGDRRRDGDGNVRKRDEIVVMMNARSAGKRGRFIDED
jgi:hypothetical protein